MPAIGPQYLPIRVIADWRCLTMISGLTCAAAKPARLPSVTASAAATRLFVISSSPLVAAWAASMGNTPCGPGIPLAQPRSVLRYRADFALGEARGHTAHHAVGVVGTTAFLEGLELGGDVFSVLAGDARVLRRDARTRGAVATSAGRNAARGVA